jgi:trk system potassium uptake protein TrkH
LGELKLVDKIFNSLFLSISTRTAGFNSIDITNINDPTLVLICLLMFVGGGPQGTAGGIKITTFVILAKYLINVLSSQGFVVISGSNVSKKSVAMSTRLYFLSTSSLAIIIFILTYLHGVNNAIQIITFEVISAFSTVGLSLGITSSLGDLEKIIFIFLMYVGRIGIFTVLIAITGNTATSFEDDDGLKIQVG